MGGKCTGAGGEGGEKYNIYAFVVDCHKSMAAYLVSASQIDHKE